jgi:hypothetical protein
VSGCGLRESQRSNKLYYPGTLILLTSAVFGVTLRVESAGDDSATKVHRAGFC